MQPYPISDFDELNDELNNKEIQVYATAGYERVSNIKKRAQINYGIDFIYSHLTQDTDANFSQGGYYYGRESYSNGFGIGPILGIRFWIWNRLTIGTEASFIVSTYKTKSRDFRTRMTASVPELPREEFAVSRGTQVSTFLPLQLWIGMTL